MSFGFGKNSGPIAPPSGPTSFGSFSRPQSPTSSPPPFPDTGFSAGPGPRFPSPRTFDAHTRTRPPSLIDNGHNARLVTSPSQPYAAPARAPLLHRGDKQIPLAGDFGNQSNKRPFPSTPQDLGTTTSSKFPHFQNPERSRTPPIRYDDDFLQDPASNIMERNADVSSDYHDRVTTQRRQSPSSTIAASPSIIHPQPSWSNSQRPVTSSQTWGVPGRPVGRTTSSQNERSISPTKNVNTWSSKELSPEDDFQRNSYVHREVSRRPSLSPPKSRIGMSSGQLPDSQYNHQLSPSVDRMNGDTYMTKPASHSVSKRTRSPSSSAGQIIQMNSNPTEDDTDREEQAKAKRLARFKTEHDIVESERGDTIQRGQNVTKGKVPSITDRSVVEKQKSLGDLPSGSLENQDIDNEDLLSSSAIVGLCTDMCPESERGERERKGDLDQYERLDGDRNQTTETLAVKKYNRTAEREAELIRPLPILEKTMDYLLGLLDQPYDDRFLRLYNFMWDRMRAIRMDLRMQHIFNERAITMLEQMIRLHILAMHELCEFSKGEGFSEGFDAHLNIEQMNKTSVELFQMYDDHRKRGIFIPTEKEFRGYYALLKLDKHPGYKVEPSELSLDLANMTVEIRQTLDVLFARDVARSCRTANFVAFFRHARKASYLQACLMHAHFSKLRTQALASLHSGLQNNQGIPVAQVAKWLGMEGEDIESLLEYHGFLIKEFEEPYMVKEGPFLNDDKDYPTRCSTLVHRKKSDTIVKDVLSSHQVTLLPSEPRKELQSDKQRKNNHAAVKPLQTRIPLVSDDGLMDIEAVSSPIRNIQDQPSLEISTNMISRDIQSFMDPRHMVSAKSPKENIDTFASFQSNSMLNQPSPLSPRHGSFIADAGQLSFKEPPKSFPVQPFVPVANSSNFVWTRQDNFIEPVKSSLEVVVQSEPKSVRPEVVPAYVVKVPTPVSETDSSVVSSIQDNVSMKEMPSEELYDMQQKVDVDIVENYDEEVAEAKLRLLLRLWRRRSVRKKFIREQNRLAANVALSSLSLGPPIWQNQDKPTPCQKLNIDQAMNERYEKSQLSLVRWNVSDLVASKLAEKNENVNCICWKVISFSWLQHGMEARSPVSHLSLDEWLRYKLIPARKEESVENLVISAPGLSVWRKWDSDESGDLRCCLSVVKETQPGAFEKNLVGVNAILFPISETLPWDTQKAQLNNLVTLLPAGACIPLLITSGSGEANFAEVSCSIVDNLGLEDLDKSRVSNFMVFRLIEEGQGQFHGFFSDQKLKEGLMWLASESHSQLGLFCVTIREVVSFHLNSCLDALDLMGDKVGPYQCISAFNQALDQSINNITTAANMNPTGWPCPELSLLDDATAEFKAMKQFLPTLGWSSPEEVEPLISALRNCMLPPFPDDLSWLSRGCSSEKDIEDQNHFLQDCLIRYFTQSVNMLNLMMATKEALLMVQKYTRLELHDTEYKVVPNWVLIFRRVFNWYINSSASFSCKAYILEESLSAGSPLFFDKLELEVPKSHYITHPSLDEMVEVSCSPIVSKRIRSSPKALQKVAAIASSENTFGITVPDLEEERNHCSDIHTVEYSDIYPRKNNTPLVLEDEKRADRLSQLLDQCNVLQDDIEKKLSIYF
ncbi:SAC3 family protein B-like isoform X1 [Chenopodium quinoa]|uniref:PCI domain-containing protein n=2 Tax=Chenopodium quinoa TaxID=63459 RepID=A0A803M7J2_CHEQI|nr:SAC3 family protein B-like isoform X1 [Chenopodium quinoa]